MSLSPEELEKLSPEDKRKAMVAELKNTIEFLAARDQSNSEVFEIPHPTPITDLLTRSLGLKSAIYRVGVDHIDMKFIVSTCEMEKDGRRLKSWGVRVENESNGNVVDDLVYKDWEDEDFVSLDPRDGGKKAPIEHLFLIYHILGDIKRKKQN